MGAEKKIPPGSEPAIDGPVDGHNVGVVLNLTIHITASLMPFSRDIIATLAAIPVRRQPGSTRQYNTVNISFLLTRFKELSGGFVRVEETCHIKHVVHCFS